MTEKKGTKVVIGGKIFNLAGYESEEYLQKVALYLNNRLEEVSSTENFRKISFDTQNLMVQLNIADDYFKAKKAADEMEATLSDKDKELYDIKHELVTSQMKLEENQKTINELKRQLSEAHRRIIELEASKKK